MRTSLSTIVPSTGLTSVSPIRQFLRCSLGRAHLRSRLFTIHNLPCTYDVVIFANSNCPDATQENFQVFFRRFWVSMLVVREYEVFE